MDIDPLEIVETAQSGARRLRAAWLNPAVAITVALLATFMGICKVKDDNIVQAMQAYASGRLGAMPSPSPPSLTPPASRSAQAAKAIIAALSVQ